jgi:hypothetical protein
MREVSREHDNRNMQHLWRPRVSTYSMVGCHTADPKVRELWRSHGKSAWSRCAHETAVDAPRLSIKAERAREAVMVGADEQQLEIFRLHVMSNERYCVRWSGPNGQHCREYVSEAMAREVADVLRLTGAWVDWSRIQ